MEATFDNLTFRVRPGRVFMPRPATERIVDTALDLIGDRPARVADVGTGTGVIAVSLAVRKPKVEVWATDTSEPAVELARENAERYDVSDRVHVFHGDLLDPILPPMDVVVANLPYLPASAHDPRYEGEPPEAVYAPGDGLDPYRRLLNACREGRLVTPGGKVVLQYHREPLTADCWQLEDLRAELEEKQLAAA